MPKVVVYANRFETSRIMPTTIVQAWHTVSETPFRHVPFQGHIKLTNEKGLCTFDLPEGEKVTFLFLRDGYQPSRTPLYVVSPQGIQFENYFDNVPSQIPSNWVAQIFAWMLFAMPPAWGGTQFAVATIREPGMTQAHYPQGAVGCQGKLIFTNPEKQAEWEAIQKRDKDNEQYNKKLEKKAFFAACLTTLATLYFYNNSTKPILSGSTYFLYRALSWLFLSKFEKTDEAAFYASCIHTLVALCLTKDLKRTVLPSASYLLFRTIAWRFFAKHLREFYTGIIKWGPFTNKTYPSCSHKMTSPDGGYAAVTAGMKHSEHGDECVMPIQGPKGIKVSCNNTNPAGDHIRFVMFNGELNNAPPASNDKSPTAEKPIHSEHGFRTMYKAPKHREISFLVSSAVGLAVGIAAGTTFFKRMQKDRIIRSFAESVGVVTGFGAFAAMWEGATFLYPDNKPEDEAKLSFSPG